MWIIIIFDTKSYWKEKPITLNTYTDKQKKNVK